MRSRKFLRRIGIVALVATVAAAMIGFARHDVQADWRNASRASIGIAPDPATHTEAIIQVYSARAYNWRGYFGVHTWIAAKRTGALGFKVYEVIGWRSYHGGNPIVVSGRPPDGRWFGASPKVLADVRGPHVDDVIDRLEVAVESYPYNASYRVWPGPNSNTFVAHVARVLPELGLDMPPTAIGKDWIPDGVVARAPSGTGWQFNLFGLFGVMAALEEGVEVNFLGLTFGLDPNDLAIKLPMAGRIGLIGARPTLEAPPPVPATSTEKAPATDAGATG